MPEPAIDRNRYFSTFGKPFHPFTRLGAPRPGVVFYDWIQSGERHCIIAANQTHTENASWFYTDGGITLAEAEKLLDVKVMSTKEFDEKHWNPHLAKGFPKMAMRIRKGLELAPAIIASAETLKPSPLDFRAKTTREEYFTDPQALTYKAAGSDHTFTDVTVRVPNTRGGFYDQQYAGLLRYALNCVKDTYGKGFEADPAFAELCQAQGLIYYAASCLKPVMPFDNSTASSLFGYSVDGGIACNSIALNLATGHIVPLDSQNDISTHKHGWSYMNKYLGAYGQSHFSSILRVSGANWAQIDSGIDGPYLKQFGGGIDWEDVLAYLALVLIRNGLSPDAEIHYPDRDDKNREYETSARQLALRQVF